MYWAVILTFLLMLFNTAIAYSEPNSWNIAMAGVTTICFIFNYALYEWNKGI